jgi:excisionase family DNA binding protein
MERLLTCKDLAERLQLSEKTIYNMVSEGRIPCVRVNNRCVRFEEHKVREWLKRYEQKGRVSRRISVDGHDNDGDGKGLRPGTGGISSQASRRRHEGDQARDERRSSWS